MFDVQSSTQCPPPPRPPAASPGHSLVAFGPTREFGRKAVSKTDGSHYSVVLDLATTPPTELWRSPQPVPAELIATASHVVLGLKNRVVLIDSTTGQPAATLKVNGTAHGLAAAAGRLFVSTDRGTIHAFGN